ncbi:MAG TPA: 4Fe-4S dicluster domain-containing protein, partial [Fimbriimonadaceae bacterium]|nr:4Fe-4S dicluster domain-containing protein [Fimbriimonadaceae bacterium]
MKPLDELTAHCIRCGFCLESCPTFLLTGEETESPRGRIYLVRSADEGKLDWEETRPHLMRCLGCLACQTACPSGVEYGQIFEIARDRLESARPHRTTKALLASLTSPARIRVQLKIGSLLPGRKIPVLLSKLLSGEPPEANRPTAQPANTLPPLDEAALPKVRGEVYLLEGCVMRILFPRVHEATRRLLRRVGYAVREVPQGCCGSLHLHAGYMDEARSRAIKLAEDLKDDLPIIVDSAGCGSTMKGYGELTHSTPNPLLIFPRSEREAPSVPRHEENEEGALEREAPSVPRHEENEE